MKFKIAKVLKYTILIIIALFILKSTIVTGYCSFYTPNNKIDSEDYFSYCLYSSYLKTEDNYFLELLDRINDEKKSTSIKDYLYNINMKKGNIERANIYLNKWKQIDYKNGTFEYFGVQQTNNYYKVEKENFLYQEELNYYKKYSRNKDLSLIIQRYKNWLSMNEKEKFYHSGLEFIEKFERESQ